MLALAHSIVHLLDAHPAEPTTALTKLMADEATVKYVNMLSFPMRVALDQSSQFYMSEYIDRGSEYVVLFGAVAWTDVSLLAVLACGDICPSGSSSSASPWSSA